MPNPGFNLYLVTDRKLAPQRDLLDTLHRALDGGVKAIQLREKDLSTLDLYRLAEKVKRLSEPFHAGLYINDRIDVALAADATGVHLGNASLPVAEARRLLGSQYQIGVSTHSLPDAKAAQTAGADFIVFGPVYYTPSKASYGPPQGLKELKKILENVSLPVYAIGGIKADNAKKTMTLGCAGVALISEIMGAKDPKSSTERLIQLLQG